MPMADYQTFSYIMYKEKEHQQRMEEERIKREQEEEKRQQEAARKADEENNAEKAPMNIREIIRQQKERAAKAKEKRISGNKSEENKPTDPPISPRAAMDISISDLEEFLEEEM